MYAAAADAMLFPSSAADVQQFNDFFFCHSHNFNPCTSFLDNLLIETSSVSDYDLGGEGDLFKAAQPIITTLIGNSPQQLVKVPQQQDFFNDVFFECNNLLPKEPSPLSEVIKSFSFPPLTTDENLIVAAKENINVHPSSQIPKSFSSDSLNSMDWIQGGAQLNSDLLNFTEIDFGMRRAFSEGDIKTLSDGVNYHHPLGQAAPMMTEDRMQKLSRYRNKKTKRNFGRKIKYACRKALADSQPRIRGRFAKTDESDIFRK